MKPQAEQNEGNLKLFNKLVSGNTPDTPTTRQQPTNKPDKQEHYPWGDTYLSVFNDALFPEVNQW
jgi:hypothetical protein